MTEAIYEIRKDQYATALRELLRHENDLTNHRIMWLLIGQGFIANAFVTATTNPSIKFGLPIIGILLTLSAFVMLYKSYQARGYIEFLGQRAKEGKLEEEYLPLMGWPRKRVSDWRNEFWMCPWIRKTDDLLEPWLFLPALFMFMWLTGFLQHETRMATEAVILLAAILTFTILAAYCFVVVHFQIEEERLTEKTVRRADERAVGN